MSDDERLESAMATGSDAGTPGEHPAEPDLAPDERALLDELRRPGPSVVGQAVEYTGWPDVSLSSSGDYEHVNAVRVTSGSMPPPTQFGGQFYGDYSGLDAQTDAMPIWMDTRDPELFPCVDSSGRPSSPPQVCAGTYTTATGSLLANDQNVYTAVVGVASK